MEEVLRIIVAEYLNAEPAAITDFSAIILPGSILIHRMYAAISKAANIELSVSEYMAVGTFGELKKLINSKKGLAEIDAIPTDAGNEMKANTKKEIDEKISIGFDIETISKFPKVDDFREDKFYSDSFTPHEISNCILKPDPYQSLAGKFAAKEAIIKTGRIEKINKLKDIEVLNDENGKPIFRDFCLSISHTAEHAAACAVWLADNKNGTVHVEEQNEIKELDNNYHLLSKEITSIKSKLKISYLLLGLLVACSVVVILSFEAII